MITELLVSRAEHIAGKKLLELELRWGEKIMVEVCALSWRALQKLAAHAAEKGLDHHEHIEMLVKASLPKTYNAGNGSFPMLPENLLDKLNSASAAQLQRVCLALSLGEKAASPKAETPPTASAEATGSGNASTPSANLSSAAGPSASSPGGVPPSSPSSTESTKEGLPVAT